MTPAEAARKFTEAARRLPDAVKKAEAASLLDLKNAAIARSQGPLQPRDLHRMGHPYARRRLRLNPDIINRVSGEFQSGWQTSGPRFDGGDVKSALFNVSVKAGGLERGLVFGRPVMVRRGPHLAAYRSIEGKRQQRLSSVWQEVFR